VVAFLHPDGPPPVVIPGRSEGVLATGTITSADLVGPLAGAGMPLSAIESGNAHANVHTSALQAGRSGGRSADHALRARTCH